MLQIAICEDNPVHTQRLSDMLAQILDVPYTLQSFSDPKTFCQILPTKEIPFNLIFMDIKLGESSGIELAHKINAHHPGTPIIFISQYLEYVSSVYETEHIYFINKETMGTYLPQALLLSEQLDYPPKMDDAYQSIRKWNHDYMGHLLSLTYLLEQKKYDEASQYITDIVQKNSSNKDD